MLRIRLDGFFHLEELLGTDMISSLSVVENHLLFIVFYRGSEKGQNIENCCSPWDCNSARSRLFN